ncbi:MAG: ACP phosphodiesterase [Bacteroidia bacterium]|nr:ACP phosphodiesterase [Bacteroidia bacterium]
MNFLAHLYLSGDQPAMRVGGFVADFVKGSILNTLPHKVQQGVRLHRQIDSFTDLHPNVQQTVILLKPSLGRYAGVAADILFDHFLAKNFQYYTTYSLPEFVTETHLQLTDYLAYFPPRAQVVWSYCTSQNWLLNYAHWIGIERSFHGMTKRTGQTKFIESLAFIPSLLPEIQHNFEAFWPGLVAFSEHSCAKLLSSDA